MTPHLAQIEQDAVAEATAAGRFGPAALERRVSEVREHYERVCERRADYIAKNAYYYKQVFQLLRFIIPPGKRVLQVGCLTPDFLHAVAPSFGVGIDLSPRQVELARQRFPHLKFQVHTNYNVGNFGTFDHVIITDINDQADPIASLRALASVMNQQTRVIVQNYNHLWEPLLRLTERLGQKFPLPLQNWLSTSEVANILRLCDYEPLQVYRRVVVPKKIPVVSGLANSFVARLPGVERLNMICLTVARPLLRGLPKRDRSVSVVVPCRDEVGNVAAAVERIPDLGSHTEIIFCDDKSTDGTADEVRRLQNLYPERDIKLYDGPGISKALNVRAGFDHARGEILMILDADLTTMPEELPYFYDVIASGKAEFVNGSRFVFPMEGEAMRPLNIAGNRFFSAIFSFLLGQRITDTLCGTKALWHLHWPAIRALAGSWGADDRWGDYDLLFGAAKLHLRLLDLPVHYQERVSGVTKMTRRFRNGLLMARMCWAAFLKFKLR
jgi:Glycosyl transferase family 2/Methyltransferase domain